MNGNRVISLLIGAVFVMFLCVFALGIMFAASQGYRLQSPVTNINGVKPVNDDDNSVAVTPIPTVNHDGVTDKVKDNGYRKYNKDADWIGDDLDVEHTLPDTVVGPAIANLRSYRGSICGVVAIHEGETLTWNGGGAYWPAGSEGALVERWQHHVDEFLADYPDCANVYESAEDVPNPTK